MATTYNNSSSGRDRARRLLGDTGVDGNSFLLHDEEIDAELSISPFYIAVAYLAEGLASRFAQFPSDVSTPGSTSLKWSDRVSAWQELAKRLRAEKAGSRGSVKLGTLTNPTEDRIR